MTRVDDYRARADRLAALVARFTHLVDLPSLDQIVDVLVTAGWSPSGASPHPLFTAGDVTARIRVDRATATIAVELADFGCSDDLECDDFDDDDAYVAALDQRYTDAEEVVGIVSGRLGLPSADALAVDVLADHGDRVRLRAGHWAVTVAVVQHDSDLPVIVEANLSYGADLPGRLTDLVPPPPHRTPVDWDGVSSRVGTSLPRDYHWLMERYGAGTFDGYLSLTPPTALSTPVPGPLVGVLRYQTPATLPVATTVDGTTLSWVLSPAEYADQWHLRVTGPDDTSLDLSVGLLQFLVVALSGGYAVPQFRVDFPSASPRFVPVRDVADAI
ncbi:hypothetical protein [Plantactinospora soyae]|uniref:Uncharacterized protein n=1 Tax=Plantactinospora soyae TaxID=1544732 RepID=A0A927MAY1_9ACTN|nr:hypothetical protein [Plantactinospora soyae]MBE1491403.1 hypothetical protein [Plantactinospora soyae]